MKKRTKNYRKWKEIKIEHHKKTNKKRGNGRIGVEKTYNWYMKEINSKANPSSSVIPLHVNEEKSPLKCKDEQTG